MIKNLSQLKKALVPGAEFAILQHNYHSEYTGQRRKVNIANTMGIYSIAPDEPHSKATQANFGKGVWLGWGKASEWEFDGDTVTLYIKDKPHGEEHVVMKFRVTRSGENG